LLMIFVFFLNLYFILQTNILLYQLIMLAQVFFYLLAVLGWLLETRQVRIKILFIPYYFCFMNYCMLAGTYRYLFTQKASVLWDKAKRK